LASSPEINEELSIEGDEFVSIRIMTHEPIIDTKRVTTIIQVIIFFVSICASAKIRIIVVLIQ
jgi:hypothetical protein